jgi:o-succinylbenzoate---CoA ligase
MGRIISEKQSFSFEQIKAGLPREMDPDLIPAFLFCHEWLNGKEEFILFTSGSTGLPKPIKLTRQQMELSAQATGEALHLRKGDTALVCLNTSYIAGIMMLVRGMVLDMDLVLVAPISSPLDEIVNNPLKIDFAAFVPLQIQTILDHNGESVYRLNQMKAIIVGGAPVSQALEQQIQSLSAPVFSTYGMTETVSHIALRRLNGIEKQDDFKVVPGVSIARDERGCLKILSPVTQGQWIQTNDVVVLTGPDRFQWLGRADYTINSGGIKIQPETLETILEKVVMENGISTFFIAGLPHPQLGEAITLFIETDHSIDNTLSEKIKALLTNRFHVPKAIIPLKSFPKTATGKTERTKVTELFKDFYSGKNQ